MHENENRKVISTNCAPAYHNLIKSDSIPEYYENNHQSDRFSIDTDFPGLDTIIHTIDTITAETRQDNIIEMCKLY